MVSSLNDFLIIISFYCLNVYSGYSKFQIVALWWLFFFSFKSFPTAKNNKITLHLGLELYVHFLLCSDGFALIMVFIGRWNLLTTLKHVHFTLAYLEYLKDFMLALNLSLMVHSCPSKKVYFMQNLDMHHFSSQKISKD